VSLEEIGGKITLACRRALSLHLTDP
jgi:hypothetical protein